MRRFDLWIITRRRLREFWSRHPQAEPPLRTWYRIAAKAQWQHIEDVRGDFPTADGVDQWTVFNIGRNDFRLVVRIDYLFHKVYVHQVMAHAEYDKGKWR
jgi:mRNA interferase HigB